MATGKIELTLFILLGGMRKCKQNCFWSSFGENCETMVSTRKARPLVYFSINFLNTWEKSYSLLLLWLPFSILNNKLRYFSEIHRFFLKKPKKPPNCLQYTSGSTFSYSENRIYSIWLQWVGSWLDSLYWIFQRLTLHYQQTSIK